MIKSRQVGENALQRMVRLLREFSQKMVKDNQEIQVRISPDGSGELSAVEGGFLDSPVFNFHSPEELVRYLESGALSQILMSRRASE